MLHILLMRTLYAILIQHVPSYSFPLLPTPSHSFTHPFPFLCTISHTPFSLSLRDFTHPFLIDVDRRKQWIEDNVSKHPIDHQRDGRVALGRLELM